MFLFSWLIATRTCLRFRDGVTETGPHWLPQAVCVGRLFRQAGRRRSSGAKSTRAEREPLGSGAKRSGTAGQGVQPLPDTPHLAHKVGTSPGEPPWKPQAGRSPSPSR